MRILVLKTGDYGQRHIDNMNENRPEGWLIESWQTPRSLPIVLDYPEEYLPDMLPAADLILSLAELSGVAEMIPDIAQMTGAISVIAPIDSQAWLPYGLARQLRGWLERDDVNCITPMPFCSLTETHFNALRLKQSYDDPVIREFASYFGRPKFNIKVDRKGKVIEEVEVIRDACCGCARFTAEKLAGEQIVEAIQNSGLHHHHYPCQASMGIDPLFGDTLMHVSGNIMKDAVKEALGSNLDIQYIRPVGYTDSGDDAGD